MGKSKEMKIIENVNRPSNRFGENIQDLKEMSMTNAQKLNEFYDNQGLNQKSMRSNKDEVEGNISTIKNKNLSEK